jgi:hypothetical protein
MTSQEAFQRILRERIGPALRALGCKGSGQSYVLPSEGYWALIGFQKSTRGDARRTSFTINVTVVDRRAWAQARLERQHLPERPSPNTRFGEPVWQVRIGQLLPDASGGWLDRWWDVPAEGVADSTVSEVIEAIRDHALPAMRERMR